MRADYNGGTAPVGRRIECRGADIDTVPDDPVAGQPCTLCFEQLALVDSPLAKEIVDQATDEVVAGGAAGDTFESEA